MTAVTASGTGNGSRSSRAVAQFKRWAGTTPGILRLLSLAIVAGAILMSIFAFTSVQSKSGTIDTIGNHTVPAIIDGQRIHADLVDADRSAAVSFLAGGQGTDAAHTQYLTDVKNASHGLEQSAQHTAYGEEVREPLQSVISKLNTYTALVERARANARLGLPVGQAYLNEASRMMHEEILPAVDQLGSVNSRHLESDYSGGGGSKPLIVIAVVGLLALALLGAAQLFHYRRFRRLVNVPMAVASALLVLFMLFTSMGMIRANAHLDTAKSASYTQLNRAYEARSLAYDANLNQTLSLIARGNGAQFDEAFTSEIDKLKGLIAAADDSAASDAELQAVSEVRAAYGQFVAIDAQVRELLSSGQRNDALTLAQGDLAQSFARLDASLQKVIDMNTKSFASDVHTASGALTGLALAALLVPLLMVLLSLWGLQQRIREYKA